MNHLKPTGWFSAGLPPMARMTSAFLMSTHPLVIAPRPNVAAKLATVGPCQTRAWVSRYGTPRAVMTFHWRKLNSLVSVQPPIMAMPGLRLTDLSLGVLGDEAVGRASS